MNIADVQWSVEPTEVMSVCSSGKRVPLVIDCLVAESGNSLTSGEREELEKLVDEVNSLLIDITLRKVPIQVTTT